MTGAAPFLTHAMSTAHLQLADKDAWQHVIQLLGGCVPGCQHIGLQEGVVVAEAVAKVLESSTQWLDA